jgi:hypothetical protein
MPPRKKHTTTGAIVGPTPRTTSPQLDAALAGEATRVRRWLRPDALTAFPVNPTPML